MSVPYTLVEKSVLRKPNSTKTIQEVLTETVAWMDSLQEGQSVANFFYYAEVVDADTKSRYFVYSTQAQAYFTLSHQIIEADSVSNQDNVIGLPDQTGNSGKVLTTDGTNATWEDARGGITYTESSTQPTNPGLGDEWFDLTDGTLYKRVSDGTNEIWLSISGGVSANPTAGSNLTNTETFAGWYRHGKPVYQIEVDCGTLPNADTKSTAIPNWDASYTYWIDDSSSYNYKTDGSDNSMIPINWVYSTTDYLSCWLNSTGGISTKASSATRTGWTTKVVLNYTK